MSKNHSITRRGFLAGVAAWTAAPLIIPRSALAAPDRPGANDRVQVGFIGVGRRCQDLFRLPKGMQGVAAADVHRGRLEKHQANGWKVFTDYRELLADPSIDAVVVATPDHWHAQPAIDACRAGKDVYVEKPMTLTIREGRLMTTAARENNRIVMTGSQQRSMAPNRLACELIRTGKLGAVKEVLAANYPSPWDCDLPEEPLPDGLLWDEWCGQTTVRPYHRDLYLPRADGRKDALGRPLGWISFKAYSGGEMTGWGSHGLDQIQSALGMDDTGPVEIWADGTDLVSKVHMRYANGVTVHLDGGGKPGGGKFVCEEGTLDLDRGRFTITPDKLAKSLLKDGEGRPDGKEDHLGHWEACIRSRELPVTDVETGHRSTTVCHLGNIARWVGRPLKWDPAAETFVDDEEANTHIARPQREPYTVG